MQIFKRNDSVRSLVTIQIPGWKTICSPGYHFTVQQVNDDGTLLLSRSGPAGQVTVATSDVEPAYKVCNGVSYSSLTPDAVIGTLEAVRKARTRIRVRLGDRETGRDWLDEWDVEGTIGTSMGPTRIPLLIHNRRSLGGPGLLDDAIIKISTTGKGRRTLYRHEKYHTGKMEIVPPNDEGYAAAVIVDGTLHAQFKTHESAQRWMKKMGA